MNIVPKNVLKYRSQKSMMKYEGAPSFTATRWTRPGTSARRFFFWTPRISIPVHWIFFLLRRTGRRFSDGFWAAGRPPTGRRATFEQLHRRWCPTWSRSAQIIHTHKHRRTTLQNSRQREKNPYPVVFFCFLYPATSLSSFSIYAVVLGGRFAMDTTFQKRRSRIKFEKSSNPYQVFIFICHARIEDATTAK